MEGKGAQARKEEGGARRRVGEIKFFFHSCLLGVGPDQQESGGRLVRPAALERSPRRPAALGDCKLLLFDLKCSKP